MDVKKKYLIRRSLDFYSELEFAKFLEKKGYLVFYPFRDVGIDMMSYKNGKIELYQLKSRNEHVRYPNIYWFPIRKKDIIKLEEYSRFFDVFFVLCALQTNGKFDFFKIPLNVVKQYIRLREKTTKKRDAHFLEIKRISERNYEIKPERIRKQININNYLL